MERMKDITKDILGRVMNYVILEKAKPYIRTRKGKFEHVKGYQGKEKVYHGTSISLVREILSVNNDN